MLDRICEPVHMFHMSEPRISVRCSDKEKRSIQDAADALGINFTAFVVMTMRKEASAVLRKRKLPVPFLDENNEEGQRHEQPKPGSNPR